jgi:hypothetical protein
VRGDSHHLRLGWPTDLENKLRIPVPNRGSCDFAGATDTSAPAYLERLRARKPVSSSMISRPAHSPVELLATGRTPSISPRATRSLAFERSALAQSEVVTFPKRRFDWVALLETALGFPPITVITQHELLTSQICYEAPRTYSTSSDTNRREIDEIVDC